MRDLTAIIDAIQTVRRARRRFLCLWRLERLPVYLASVPSALDRLAADIAGGAYGETAGAELTTTTECAILNTRTSWLFRQGRMTDE